MIHLVDLPDITRTTIDMLPDPSFIKQGINVDVMRLDKIHAVISGNKWFKLRYYLETALEEQKKGIITFGGAYSNHLLATAYASQLTGLHSIGIVRGEKPSTLSPTLANALNYDMTLQFVSRALYSQPDLVTQMRLQYPDYLVVEEGGRGKAGIKGAEEILQIASTENYTHILCAVGTGTTMTAIVDSCTKKQHVIGIPVLKIRDGIKNSIAEFVSSHTTQSNFSLDYRFHFGGYAKKDKELLAFMNTLYARHNIPSDFVYTGKLFFAAFALAAEGRFPEAAKVLILHSGGLQGNRSLPHNLLDF